MGSGGWSTPFSVCGLVIELLYKTGVTVILDILSCSKNIELGMEHSAVVDGMVLASDAGDQDRLILNRESVSSISSGLKVVDCIQRFLTITGNCIKA